MSGLLGLHRQIATCKDCHHFKEHWKFSHDAHGKYRSEIMVVGESSHKPSIDAGKYYATGSLRSILENILDIDRECYLTDLVKCDKSYLESKEYIEEAARSCSQYLYKEINLVKPKIIISVGELAFRLLTNLTGTFSKRQDDGEVYQYHNISVIPIIHPSYGDIHYGKATYQMQKSYRDSVREIFLNALNM